MTIKYSRIKYYTERTAFTVILLAALLFLFPVFSCRASEGANTQKVLRVAFPQSDGYTMTSPEENARVLLWISSMKLPNTLAGNMSMLM